MVIDGKQIAEDILAEIGDSLRGKRLGIVMGQDDAATQSFIRIKSKVAARLGVEVVHGDLAELLASCDGVLVQLPMANSDELLAQLPPEKDVDGLGSAPAVLPPVAGAVAEILMRNQIGTTGKKAVIVGAGKLVGKPVAAMLKEMGADVSVITSQSGSLEELKSADIAVLGAGNPGFVTPDMLKPGVVLIDAGTSESNGKLAGDADPACAEVASLFTPVPGGIGPIAVAMIFKNLLALSAK
jgi:methylenetetrahydrofolate dehydrogenase (NADP+)/methenyltetrahydrofolate cyclohydrolase